MQNGFGRMPSPSLDGFNRQLKLIRPRCYADNYELRISIHMAEWYVVQPVMVRLAESKLL